MPRLPLTAAPCGRFFICKDGWYAENAGAIFCECGLGLLWLLLLAIWLLPSEQTSLPLGLTWVWLSCFGLTLTSYGLILLQRIGVSLLRESDDE